MTALFRPVPCRRPLLAAVVLLLSACGGAQSALDPSGPAARAVDRLWWVLLILGTAVTLAVFALLLVALFRHRDFRGTPPPYRLSPSAAAAQSGHRKSRNEAADVRLETFDEDRRAVRWVVGAGAGATGVIVLVVLIYTLHTLGALSERRPEADLTIEVTGWQWWWQVRYLDAGGAPLFETANEIHIPVGQRVRVRLKAADVIHSFWVPRLAGKLDMIPGRTNTLWLQADEPGTYRGQCAEYCDGPHGLMGMLVIAEPEADFRAWVGRERRPAGPTQPNAAAAGADGHAGHEHGGDVLVRGRQVFLTNACAGCHTIRGTPAAGRLGPDLTHVAGRRTLAAATIPNDHGHLGGWISNPQRVKPGSKMPAVPMDSEALIALLHYLRSLE